MTVHGKKKVLYVVEAMGGGIFSYIVDLANALADTYDMYIAYAVRPQTPANFEEYFDKRIHLIKVENFTREISPVKDLKALKEIKQIAAKIKPDLIHLHSSKAGILGRVAYNGRKTPLFYTPHGYSFLMADYNPIKRFAFKMIEKVAAIGKSTTISCSVGEHEETLKLTKRAKYVNNGINTVELEQLLGKVRKTDHPFTVFTLGRICYQKNPALFNQVAESLPQVQFLWIGEGELRNELKAPNIEITGWVDREEALRRSVNADVFVLTSLWEGLPISLLEAMYMKKLCVVSDVIGNHDVIHTGENGYVCTGAAEFAKAIESYSSDDTDRLKLAAYNDIEQLYNTSVMANSYMTIYEEAIKEK